MGQGSFGVVGEPSAIQDLDSMSENITGELSSFDLHLELVGHYGKLFLGPRFNAQFLLVFDAKSMDNMRRPLMNPWNKFRSQDSITLTACGDSRSYLALRIARPISWKKVILICVIISAVNAGIRPFISCRES